MYYSGYFNRIRSYPEAGTKTEKFQGNREQKESRGNCPKHRSGNAGRLGPDEKDSVWVTGYENDEIISLNLIRNFVRLKEITFTFYGCYGGTN